MKAWITYGEFAESLEPLVSSEELSAAFSVADELSCTKIIMHFSVEGCDYVKGVNLLVNYAPLSGLIRVTRVEVVLSSELPARSLLNSRVSELNAISVNVSKEMVSIILRVTNDELLSKGIREYLSNSLMNLAEKLNIPCGESVKFSYEGFTVVG